MALLFFVLSGFMVYAKWAVLKNKANALAHFGAWLQGTGLLSKAQIQNEIFIYQKQIGLKQDQVKLEWGRFRKTPASRFYQFVFTEVQIESPGLPGPIKERWVIQQEKQ